MRVGIIHPWLPQYRLPFFHRLLPDAARQGIHIDVYHGETPLEWRQRGDTRSDSDFTSLSTVHFRIGSRTLNVKNIRPVIRHRPYDLIIVEQAIRNIETYLLVSSRTPLAFWGHGKTFTKSVTSLQERAKIALSKRGEWFFAYTESGAAAMASAGYPASQITVVQNSIDTGALRSDAATIDETDRDQFESEFNLCGATALFIGGLDESKRIPFLLEAAKLANQLLPSFRLLIAGDGEDRSEVERAAAQLPFIHYLGPLSGRRKALALTCSDVIAMPGRVGLVAVDSFAAGRPIVTTDWEWHAPEFDYLSKKNALVTPNTTADYGRGLADLLGDQIRVNCLQKECERLSSAFTVEEMSRRFVSGLLQYKSRST